MSSRPMDVPRFLYNLVNFATFILLTAVAVNLPLLIGARLLRTRVAASTLKVVVSLGSAAATGYVLYRMEWFDVWRHGTPSIAYVLIAYMPWTVAVGLAGGFIARIIVRPTGGRFAR